MRMPDVIKRIFVYGLLLALPALLALLLVYSFFYGIYRGHMRYTTGVEFCINQGYTADYCEYNWDKVQPRVTKEGE